MVWHCSSGGEALEEMGRARDEAVKVPGGRFPVGVSLNVYPEHLEAWSTRVSRWSVVVYFRMLVSALRYDVFVRGSRHVGRWQANGGLGPNVAQTVTCFNHLPPFYFFLLLGLHKRSLQKRLGRPHEHFFLATSSGRRSFTSD